MPQGVVKHEHTHTPQQQHNPLAVSTGERVGCHQRPQSSTPGSLEDGARAPGGTREERHRRLHGTSPAKSRNRQEEKKQQQEALDGRPRVGSRVATLLREARFLQKTLRHAKKQKSVAPNVKRDSHGNCFEGSQMLGLVDPCFKATVVNTFTEPKGTTAEGLKQGLATKV